MTLVMGTIFLLSHQSGDRFDFPLFPGADKIAHFLMYGSLALTILWSHGRNGLARPGRTAVFTVIFCLLYGISDEFHQSFISQRFMSALDLIADAAGAFCLTLVWIYSTSFRQRLITWQERLLTR